MPSRATTAAIPGTAAISLGIALLAAFAFVLSYDALRQMAVAIHIRGLLTYTFPLVIDGFIAIGVGALLMLRTAPLRSRVYVWALVGIATVTSIWANALHAVRLNQQTRPDGLHLDNATVGVLSAIAPLALAGAVHLYIVIRRHPAPPAKEAAATRRHNPANHGHNGVDRHGVDGFGADGTGLLEPAATEVADGHDDVAQEPANVAQNAAHVPETEQPGAGPEGHKPRAISDEMLALARSAPLGRGGRASRRHIEATIRGQGHAISKNEATRIKDVLQADLDSAVSHRKSETDLASVARP